MTTTISADARSEALGWLDDPLEHYGHSLTAIHSLPRRDVEAIQIAAIGLRLEQRRDQIAVLRKLADGEGISRISSLDDAVPLLFEHSMYKSYPNSLLSKQRYDQLTQWLGRLSTEDLSRVDTSRCDSIDSWLGAIQDQTSLDVTHSSGTSGTMSFVPRAKRDFETAVAHMRTQALQDFGQPPSNIALNGKFHVVSTGYRGGNAAHVRFAHYHKQDLAHGDDAYFHTAYDASISADLMWLAGKLRAAAARGDISRLDIPENLLARRTELERMQAEMPEQRLRFIQAVTSQLQGQLVYLTSHSHLLVEVARAGLDEGRTANFAPGSSICSGGGGKGMVLPADWKDTVRAFFAVADIPMFYGMSEMNTYMLTCQHGRHHIAPWLVVYLLDPDTSAPLPRQGVQTGRAAFFDVTAQGMWGGIISGDRITVDWDSACPCGRTTPHIAPTIERYSELQGGSDKITCAGSAAAHGEAMDYLTRIGA